MWLPNSVIAEVDRVARVYYVDRTMTTRWNEHREKNELRLLTGWCWITRDGRTHRQGFKTYSVAYRDAWYVLLKKIEAPSITHRARLRVVKSASVAA